MGLVVQRHVESSQTRDRTHVPCTGSQILNPWTTRDVPEVTSVGYDFLSSQSSPWVCELHDDTCISVCSALSRHLENRYSVSTYYMLNRLIDGEIKAQRG